jgi:hypothetical protein
MSADAEFLQRPWPKIKLATQWLIAKDANNDGLIERNQANTLGTDWYGKVAWLVEPGTSASARALTARVYWLRRLFF